MVRMFSFLTSCRNIFSTRTDQTVLPNLSNAESDIPEISLNVSISTLQTLIHSDSSEDESEMQKLSEPTVETKEEEASFTLLNESSIRLKTPDGAKITLLPHQEAMFQRCLEIESNKCKAEMLVKNIDRYMKDPHTGKPYDLS